MRIIIIFFSMFLVLTSYAHANVRYSVFINDFKSMGGSEAGVQILQQTAKDANTEKTREEYKKKLNKLIGENNIDIKCPYCYLEGLEEALVNLISQDNFDKKKYDLILDEITKHQNFLAKNYATAFSKMTKEDRVIAAKVMGNIFYNANMLEKFKAIQENNKKTDKKPFVEPRQ
jgi:hypothetical protein